MAHTSSIDHAADVVVVGGGIIGLSIAWRLAGESLSVTVLERGRCGAGASGAAAGMLAPLAEAQRPGPFTQLGLASLALYPSFVHALEEETGRVVETPSPGLLRVALTQDEARALDGATGWQTAAGLPVERLSGNEARQLEPALGPSVVAAVRSPREKQYDPRVLVDALAAACRLRGVHIIEDSRAAAFERDGSRVTTVCTPAFRVNCGQLVVAGGAWTEEIGARLDATLPVFPVKGQILALRPSLDNGSPAPLSHSVYSHLGYLVPRPSDSGPRFIVGATAERAGFDIRATAGGMAGLLNAAITLAPCLADAEFESVWTGLRPATPDGLPIIGPLPGWDNVHVAAGHFRNGILLAPVTAAVVSGMLLHREPQLPVEPYAADRFS